MVKNPPANAGDLRDMSVGNTRVRSLGQDDPLKEGMATHSSILAGKIPWKRSLADYNPWGCKESDTLSN